MRARLLVVLTLVLVASGAVARAVGDQGGRIVGVITALTVQPAVSLQVSTKTEGVREVRADSATMYAKWITHQPWQQDSRVDDRSLSVGRCVEVDLRSDDPSTAKAVRVNTDGVRTIWDPCKAMR